MPNHFDLIPPEIHQHIVSSLLSSIEFKYYDGKEYITNEISLRTILNYAKQGQDHHDAVISSLNYTIAPWECHDIATDLVLHFANDLREIDTVYTDIQFETSSCNAPKFPNLRKASVWASLPELHLIRNSPNLNNLSVVFLLDMVSGSNKTEWDFLFSAVSHLHLRTLELNFIYPTTISCDKLPMIDLIKFKNACTTVEHLSLRGCLSMSDNLSRVISEMPNLKKLSLDIKLKESNLSVLEKIPELEFFDGFKNCFAIVRKLGNRVKIMRGHVESRSQVETLISFPGLKELHIRASGELNYEIGDIVRNLEVLSISFPMYSLPGSGPTYPFYEKISIAKLCLVMKRARKLKVLSIDQVKIRSQDIEEVFKIVGSQLKQFCVCINWQEESALTRMAKILRSVAKYCPNLEVLRFLQNSFAIHPILFWNREERRTCMKALDMVKQKCDRFSSYERICSIIHNGFREVVMN